jgi:hypothetical protein
VYDVGENGSNYRIREIAEVVREGLGRKLDVNY